MRLEQHVAAVIDRVAQADRVDQHHQRRVVQLELLLDSSHPVMRHALEIDLRHLAKTGQVAPVVVENEIIGAGAHVLVT